jgi:hypothetical protein
MSGKGLSSIMKQRLELLDLKSINTVGQCYDGASNMSGQYNGVQAEIKKAAGEKAIYIRIATITFWHWSWNEVHQPIQL